MLGFGYFCTGYVGDLDVRSQGRTESSVGYHAEVAEFLTRALSR